MNTISPIKLKIKAMESVPGISEGTILNVTHVVLDEHGCFVDYVFLSNDKYPLTASFKSILGFDVCARTIVAEYFVKVK